MCFLSDFSNEKQLSQTVVYNSINVFVSFKQSSDFMISVTYFALENIAMFKVDVHQDQDGQHEDGQGQVR